jgi:hypothetical protein
MKATVGFKADQPLEECMVQREIEILAFGVSGWLRDKFTKTIYRFRANPEVECRAASRHSSSVLALERRSGNVAREPDPPPKPLAIVGPLETQANTPAQSGVPPLAISGAVFRLQARTKTFQASA